MSKVHLQIPPEFDSASGEERLAFVQALWDRIAADPDSVPVPEHHKRILRERLEAYRADRERGRPWNEVRDELLAKYRSS